MNDKVYLHTKKVFIGDAILLPFMGLGVLTGFVHLLKFGTEKLTIDDKHVKLKTGILSNNEIEVPLGKINTITVRQGLIGKIFSFGDIVVYTGNDRSGIVFKQLDEPSQIKLHIQGQMQN